MRKKLIALFGELVNGEKANEEIRIMISNNANIYYDLFKEIKTVMNSNGIQREDIYKLMGEKGYNIKDYEVEIIMEKMDRNKDNLIDYEEFLAEIQPKNV